jgi:hypothetical protein
LPGQMNAAHPRIGTADLRYRPPVFLNTEWTDVYVWFGRISMHPERDRDFAFLRRPVAKENAATAM